MEYEMGVRLDRIEQMISYIIEKLNLEEEKGVKVKRKVQ